MTQKDTNFARITKRVPTYATMNYSKVAASANIQVKSPTSPIGPHEEETEKVLSSRSQIFRSYASSVKDSRSSQYADPFERNISNTDSNKRPSFTAQESASSAATSNSTVAFSSYAKNVLCRNILIHGYCRYADKGCAFNHDQSKLNQKEEQPIPSSPNTGAISPQMKNNTTSPGSKSNQLSPSMEKKQSLSPKPSNFTAAGLYNELSMNASASKQVKEFKPSGLLVKALKQQITSSNDRAYDATTEQLSNFSMNDPKFSAFELPRSDDIFDHSSASKYSQQIPLVQSEELMYTQDMTNMVEDFENTLAYYQPGFQPTQYHLYTPLDIVQRHLNKNERKLYSFSLDSHLRETLQKKSEASLQIPNGDIGLPTAVQNYHWLVPLEAATVSNRVFGYNTSAFKARSFLDGRNYFLRRIENFKLKHEHSIFKVDLWKEVTSSNLVKIHEAFTTRAFGDDSIVFVYDYCPCSRTLFDIFFGSVPLFGPQMLSVESKFPVVSESALWGYLCQILAALKAIHTNALAALLIDPTKIIMTNHNVLKLSSLGIIDVIGDGEATLRERQAQDFVKLGKMIATLACNNPAAALELDKSMELIKTFYTDDFYQMLHTLISAKGTNNGIAKFQEKAAPHFLSMYESAISHQEFLENELMKELENGRISRLLIKLEMVTERPEYQGDTNWFSTGKFFPLHLFRDHVFHQIDENGQPVLDFGHILTCLNKLDAGSDERMMLISRDEQTCIFITYKEVKALTEKAYNQLGKARIVNQLKGS